MENNKKRNPDANWESRLTPSPEQNADQQAINVIDTATTDVIGDKMLDKLLESARVKRRSVLARKQASQANDHCKNADGNGAGESNFASVTPFITPSSGSAGKANPRPSPVAAKQKVEESPTTPITSQAPTEAVRASVGTVSSYKAHLPVAAVGALVVGVVLVNSWYLGNRIDANTQRLSAATGEQLALDTESPAESGEVARFLDLASKAFRAGLFIEPAGESALDFYRNALRLDPDNQAAHAGIRAVTDQLLLRAESALQAQRLEEATAALQAVRGIDAELPLLNLLETQISRQQSSLADAAEVSAVTDDVIPPPMESASEPGDASHFSSPVERGSGEVTAVAVASGAEPAEQSALQVEPVNKEHRNTEVEAPKTKPLAEAALRKEALPDKVDSTAATKPETAVSEPEVEGLVITPPVLAASSESTKSIETVQAADNISGLPESRTSPESEKTKEQIAERPETFVGEGAVADSDQIGETGENPATDKPVSLKRIKWVEPVTPRAAIRKGLNGWVEVAFTVNAEGETIDVKVADSSPRKIFDKAAIAAVRRWRFEPPIRDGEPVSQPTKVRFKFVVPD